MTASDPAPPASLRSPADWPDLAGRLAGSGPDRHHLLAVRVYFEDTDFSGVVYHTSYLRWCERGRSDFVRLLGNDHRALSGGRSPDGRSLGEPAAFVVRRMGLEFMKPARIDDVLVVETRAREVGAAHVVLDQRIVREGQPLFSAEVMVVLVSASGKPMRLATTLRQAFAAGGADPAKTSPRSSA
jgi:acyl-CoA thioester hydrolase